MSQSKNDAPLGLICGNEFPSWNNPPGSLYTRTVPLETPAHTRISARLGEGGGLSDLELLLMQHELLGERNYIQLMCQIRRPLPEGCLRRTYTTPLVFLDHEKMMKQLEAEKTNRAISIPVFCDKEFETALKTYKLSGWLDSQKEDQSFLKVGQKIRAAIEIIQGGYYDRLVDEHTRTKNVWDVLFESKDSLRRWLTQDGKETEPDWFVKLLN